MLDNLTDEQLCFPDSNLSCIRAQFSVGAQVCLYMVFGCCILVNIVGNSVVIMSICHFKQLHSPTNMLVLSLAVADLLVGVIVVPFSMTRTVQGCWFYGDTFCQLHSSTDMFLCSVSILHLVCIAVDRYEAVCNPLRYTNNITMSVAWLMLLACWSVPALHAFGLIYSKAVVAGVEDFLETIFCLGSCYLVSNSVVVAVDALILFFFPCSVIIGLYTKIFVVANDQVRKTEDTNQCLNSKGGLSKRREHKAAKTLGIVVGVYFICWMPFFVYFIIDNCIGFSTPTALIEVFYWLAYNNSSMNPIIYALFYPWFRKCFRLIITMKIFNHNSSDTNVFFS